MLVKHSVSSAFYATLGTLPYCLSWQRRMDEIDDLCCGRTPMVLVVPAIVDYVYITEHYNGQYCLRLDMLPLVLQDVLGLHLMVNIDRAYSGMWPCAIDVVNTMCLIRLLRRHHISGD